MDSTQQSQDGGIQSPQDMRTQYFLTLRKLLIPALLVLMLPVILVEVFTKQDNRQHAAEQAQTYAVSQPLKVLVLEYFPLSPTNQSNLDGIETGWGNDATVNGRTVKFWEQATDSMISTAIPFLNESSKYHGYKDPSAPAFLDYQVVDTKKFYTPIPRGVSLGTQSDGTPKYRPFYAQILKDNNICHYVDDLAVQEVWMYGYHSKQIEPDESRMSSKYGDISNSYPKEETIPSQYKMPDCTKAYTLYNFTYQPGGGAAMGNTIHNRIHQIENMIPFTEGKYPPIPQTQANTNIPGSIFWGDFSEYVQNTTSRSAYKSSCGNAHYPPNWQNANTDAYRYDLKTLASFNCETWNPDDTKTTYITAGCERWGCTDVGFYKYFMQNIPGYNNGIVYQGQPMKNWWEAFYDFEAFIDNGHTLYGTSIIATPTPTIDENYKSPLNLIAQDSNGYIKADNFNFTTHGVRHYPDQATLKLDSGSFNNYGGHMDFSWTENGKTNGVSMNFIVSGTTWKVDSFTTKEGIGTSSLVNTYYAGFDGGPLGVPFVAKVLDKTSGSDAVHFENLSMLGFAQLTPTPIPTNTPTPTPTKIPTATPTPIQYVSMNVPKNGSKVMAGRTILVSAKANLTTKMTSLEIYVGTTKLCSSSHTPLSCSWKVPTGKGLSYTLTARGIYRSGSSIQVSHPVTVISY